MISGSRRFLSACLLVLVTSVDLAAQSPGATARLADLARLWGDVKYHHPALGAGSTIDWDAALVRAIPSVRDATTTAEFRAAVQGMLAELHDPLTRVSADADAAAGAGDAPARPLAFELTPDSVLIVRCTDYAALASPENEMATQAALAALPGARALVLDVRADRATDDFGRLWLLATTDRFLRLVMPEPPMAEGERYRVWYGYPSTSAFSSGQYRGGLFTRFGATLRPASGARAVPLVVVLNQAAAIPGAVLSLQATGRALIVFEGDSAGAATGRSHTVPLGDGLIARVRESESVFADGTAARLRPDLLVPPTEHGGTDATLPAALGLAREYHPSTIQREPLTATGDPPLERSYPAMVAPSLEFRLLALFRYWNVIRYFYPYHRLDTERWDDVLGALLPVFESADDSLGYARAVALMAARLHDSHAYVAGRVYSSALIGAGYPPIRVRLVEGQPVVVALYDSAAARAGLRIGDIVTRVDGEAAAGRLSRCAELISASTPQSLMDKATLQFMNGPVGSTLRLVVRGADRRERTVELLRRAEDYTTLYHRERTGAVVKILAGNIGYVDLDRLELDMVDSMFATLQATRAIIFDMRGYPNNVAWAIAPRLTRTGPVASLIETPMVGHDTPRDAAGVAFESFHQTIDSTPAGKPLYTGRTVMLIDGQSESQAEHTGLYLRAANGTRFVGSATAGADGEISTVVLPGSITVGFTGQSVRFPDGRELQRRGLQPDVTVEPTISGLRAGRDEVLLRAIQLLSR